MHIVYVTSEYVTERRSGGLGTYLYNVAAMMKNEGHVIHVVTLSEKNGGVTDANGVKVIRVKAVVKGNKPRSVYNILNSIKLFKEVKSINKSEKIDIVQASNYRSVGLMRVSNIPLVVRVSSDSILLRSANKRIFDFENALKKQDVLDRLEYLTVKRADAIFAPSKICASIVSRKTGRQIEVIESPLPNMQKKDDPFLYNTYLNGKEYILVNSSLSYLKGTHVVISATQQLLTKYPNLFIVYAGEDMSIGSNTPSFSGQLAKQHKEFNGRVIYFGKVQRQRLFPIVKHALACALPSRIDNFPNSCVEAMYLGQIVLGVDGASFEQLIEDGINGFLMKRDSVDSFVKAVDRLMMMPNEEKDEMKNRAKETVKRLESTEIYPQMMSFYLSAMEKSLNKTINGIHIHE